MRYTEVLEVLHKANNVQRILITTVLKLSPKIKIYLTVKVVNLLTMISYHRLYNVVRGFYASSATPKIAYLFLTPNFVCPFVHFILPGQ